MNYMRGGNLLRIDLSSGKIGKEPTSSYQKLWLGGRGLNARILYEELKPEIDPLSPENVMMFSIGPFTGSMVPGSGRVEVAAKSPATGIEGMANMGGFWGPELKYAGYDSVIVRGKASQPVYLAINNDSVEIRDALHLWGLDTFQTQDAVQKELGDPEVEVLCIGPAGENMIAYASIQTRVGNSAGRTGMGTVMGSKNLKAIAVRGTNGLSVAEPDRFFELCLKALEVQKPLTGMANTTTAASNSPPTWALTLGNYESTRWNEQQNLRDGHKPFWEKHKNPQGEGITGCFNCQVRCMDYYSHQDHGPLVASCNVYASTSWILKDPDMTSWYALAAKCQRQGIDIMSAARMIAWAMDLYEKGRITLADTDGIELTWGNRSAIDQIVDKIAIKEGFGAVLASNVDVAGQKLGDDVKPALNIKGVPLGGTNVVNFRARTIGAVVNPRGSDEYRSRYAPFDNLGSGKDTGITGMASPDSWEAKKAMDIIEKTLAQKEEKVGAEAVITQFDYEARGVLAAIAHKLSIISDALGQCKWNTIFLNVGLSVEFQADALSAGVGRKVTIDHLLEAGSRIASQERAFSVREGQTRDQDTLPKRLINNQIPGSWPEDRLETEGLERMKDDYYQAMGWDIKTGTPSPETLQSLQMSDVASDLREMRKPEVK